MADPVTEQVKAAADATEDKGGESRVAKAHPVAAKGGATMSVSVVLLAVLVASVAVFLMSSQHADEDADDEHACGIWEGESGGNSERPVEHAVGGIPGFNSRLDAFRAWARLTWMKLRRRRSDEPPYDDAAGSAGSVAGAAKKSFEMGKETVEQAEEAVEKANKEEEARRDALRRACLRRRAARRRKQSAHTEMGKETTV